MPAQAMPNFSSPSRIAFTLKILDFLIFKIVSTFHLIQKAVALRTGALDKIVIWRVSGSLTKNALVFDDMAHILHSVLSNYARTVIISNFPHPDADITIALNSYSLCAYRGPKPTNLLIYNFEQLSPIPESQTSERYLKILKQNRVLEYSEMNCKLLDNHKISYTLVPPLYHSSLEYGVIDSPSGSEIDVVFIGSLNPRRRLLQERLVSGGVSSCFIESVYNAERNTIYRHAKLSIYCFVYDTSILPWLRLSFLLANKIPVLCERPMSDQSLDLLSSFICFANFDDLPKAAGMLVSNPGKLQEMREMGYNYISSRPIDPYIINALSQMKQFRDAAVIRGW